jgi:TolB-like protein/tetratricopeptide (TPR) repeat protein
LAGEGQDLGERRLGAIMFTDVVGYSSAASLDEERALMMLEEHRKLLQEVFPNYGGRVVKSTGDGFLVEFGSAVGAVNCAVEAQKRMTAFNVKQKSEEKVMVRIGIHVGDVVHSGADVLGDAVNVAARLEGLAEPGGICLSRQVVDQVERKVQYGMVRLGTRDLKNIRYPVEVYMVNAQTGSSEPESFVLDPRRVAILPFTNMSADPNDRYFADGMTEELISTVSKIRELQVISRTSVLRYRETEVPISKIGQELSVGSVLEGSVRKAGNKVRISAQLIEVRGDRHLWAQSYDRDLTDIFAIQGDIAERIADSLKVQLVSGEKRLIRREATASPEAYTLYLKGRFYWNERTEEGTRKALKYFEEAANLDPQFAMAYSGMADSYNILTDYAWMPPAEASPLAKSNATRALEIDDSLAEAHASLGLTLGNMWDFAASERELRRAVELRPNYATAHHWLSVALFCRRRYQESEESERRALQLDPYSRTYNMTSANQMMGSGRAEEAARRQTELIEMYPDFAAMRYWRSICYAILGRHEDAVKEAKKFVEMEGEGWFSKLNLAWILVAAGKRKEAENLVGQAVAARSKTYVPPTDIGMVRLALGEKDEGYTWLERALEERDPNLLYFNGFPWLKEYRADPRWAEIERKIGFESGPD